MTTLLLAPHADDETLFAAYTCMRSQAHVIVCMQDQNFATRAQRSEEMATAVRIMGCTHHEWPMTEDAPNWDKARDWLSSWNSTQFLQSKPDKVWVPAWHPEGHEQHNKVNELAREVFGEDVLGTYLTYAPRGHRQRDGVEVVPTTDEIHLKLRALACYRTQIDQLPTRPWFFDLLDLREWVSE